MLFGNEYVVLKFYFINDISLGDWWFLCDILQTNSVFFRPVVSRQNHNRRVWLNEGPTGLTTGQGDWRVLANQLHVLQPLLPDQSSHHYNLRNRQRQLPLTQKTTHLGVTLNPWCLINYPQGAIYHLPFTLSINTVIRSLFKDINQLTSYS